MVKKTKISFFNKKILYLKNRIGICSGDANGVGPFVIQKSLSNLGIKKNFQFVIWTNKKSPPLKIKNFKIKTFESAEKALESPFESNEILEIKTKQNPAYFVKDCGLLCLKNKLSAMVTGPLSKETICKAGFKEKGQTQILKKISKSNSVFMVFFGNHFNVILLNDHIPFYKTKISKQALEIFIKKSLSLRKFLPEGKKLKPLGILGLNPHSGEKGLIGMEEEKILKPVLKKFKKSELVGPLCPDSAFLKKNWTNFSFYLSLYHDQGLIPFKMIHPQKGFSFSLGLPFLRTGVDHGTGFDLKKNQISHESFSLALKKTILFIKNNRF